MLNLVYNLAADCWLCCIKINFYSLNDFDHMDFIRKKKKKKGLMSKAHIEMPNVEASCAVQSLVLWAW